MRVPLALPPGLVSDETTFSMPGTWADGNNTRFYRGKPQPIGPWAPAHETALTGVCRNALSWIDQTSQQNIAFGTHSNLFVLKGSTLADITPTGLTVGNVDRNQIGYGQGPYGIGPYGGGPTSEYYPRTWSLATFGQYLMASPRGKALYVWQNNTGAPAAIVAQAPAHIGSMIVTPERQVLAFGCEEAVSGAYNPMCIRGSALENPLLWNPLPTNTAFEHVLEGGGRIVAGKMLGSFVAVWTDTSVHLGQFIGSEMQDYRFDLIAENCGLANPNAVTIVNQVAYWMTPDLQFYAWQVGMPPAPIACPIREDFKDNIVTEQIDKVCSTGVSEFGEVWWFYPDDRDGPDGAGGIENSRYAALTLADGSWFRGQMVRTAVIDSGPQRHPVFVHFNGTIYNHEVGPDTTHEPLSGSIRSCDMYFDKAQRRLLVRSIWPDFEAQRGGIALTLYYRAHPQATERTKGPFVLEPGRAKRDFLADGRIFSFEFAWTTDPDGDGTAPFMRGGLPSFDVVATGER